ncbi:MAG TPA: thiolase family protein [Acidimicrobiia bacterium]|nr:thiolase family protein [Acidimicrobiia bacterium]
MSNRVAIVGVGQSVHADERHDVDVAELVLEAVDEALGDAGLGLGDMENAVTACMDFWDGRTIANMSTAEVVGSYRKSEARTCADGIQAMLYEWTRIASGTFKIGLVAAHCVESRGVIPDIERNATDVFTQWPLGIDGSTIAGFGARLLYESGAFSPRDAAEAVVESRRRGARNPKVAPLPQVTVDEVLGSPVLADPIRLLDRAPNRDGSTAFVVVSEDVAKGLDVEPVWVTGTAAVTGSYWSDADPTSTATLEAARDTAVAMAGWAGAGADLVEMSAQFSHQHLQYARAFGRDPLDERLNSSGGWLGGNPFIVTGAARIAEAVHQIRGTAGDRQLDGVHRAIAHGVHGLGAQTHSVAVLEGGAA